ncbi:hypothetical protein BDN71DRAFT_1510919 [Pleurotus eryngii]|uniref:Uncharacterized protein n=1 Tax=Pleurotus eryngii TaxID=5323 RepID=A0A9P5ZQF9_PLEER|nr:hypothetical protein BDN71DRAFT_1510919 [Pleurotus eryngii]
MNTYWAENYASKIRKEFQQYWKTAKLTAPPDSRMTMCADYVKARYDDETEEYRCALEKRADAEYKQALDEYHNRDTLDGTAEAYANAWREADNFLHVFVDAITKNAHSNNAGAMTSLIWPEFDKAGFKAMQDSIVHFGEAVFSPEECKRCIPKSSLDLDRMSTASPDLDNPTSGPTVLPDVNGNHYPPPDDPMNLIADDDTLQKPNDAMNFEMPIASRHPQGEFTALLANDWDWGNTLNWCATTSQQPPLWSNTAPYSPPIFVNGPGVPTMPPMPIFVNGPDNSGGVSALAASTAVSNPQVVAPVVAQSVPPSTPVAGGISASTMQVVAPIMAQSVPPLTPVAGGVSALAASTAVSNPQVVAPIVAQSVPPSTPVAGGVSASTVQVVAPIMAQSVPPLTPVAGGVSTAISSVPPSTPVVTPIVAHSTPAASVSPSTPIVVPIVAQSMPATSMSTPTAPQASVAAPSVPTTLTEKPSASSMSPTSPTPSGKENEAKKKRKRVEPIDTTAQERPHRTSKPPPHLQEVGYVPPTKGTRKKQAAPQAAPKTKVAPKAKAAPKKRK